MKQPTPIEWLQELYKVTGALKESDFDYANNWTKENTYTEEQVREAIDMADKYGYLLVSEKTQIIQSLKQPKKD